MMTDELLSTAQVAERLGVTPDRVRKIAKQGRLTPQLVGGTLIFRAADVATLTRRPAGRPRKIEETER